MELKLLEGPKKGKSPCMDNFFQDVDLNNRFVSAY